MKKRQGSRRSSFRFFIEHFPEPWIRSINLIDQMNRRKHTIETRAAPALHGFLRARNSVDKDILRRSCRELAYHAQVLDLMKLDTSAKVQIHVGGVHENRKRSMERFVERFFQLDSAMRRRLVVENDDRLYNVDACLRIGRETALPVLFDPFHHSVNNSNTTVNEALRLSSKTWKPRTDGIPMVDYSSRKVDGSPRQHAESIDPTPTFRDSWKKLDPLTSM